MYLNIPRLEELTEEERAQETERLLREIVTAHNREYEELRAETERLREVKTNG